MLRTARHIAIDVGTRSIKGTVVDAEKMALGTVRRRPSPGPLEGRPDGFHELDALDVVDTVRQLIAELAADAPGWDGILLCGQMGGLVFASESGEPLSNYISWLDRRTSGAFFEAFTGRIGAEGRERLGNEVRAPLPLPYLCWLAESGGLPRESAFPLTLPDFVAANLTGGVPVIERTGMTGSMDVQTQNWPRDLLDGLGLGGLRLPRVVDFRHVVGHCDTGGTRVPVYAAVGDHQCALAGTLLREGELSINISTGSQVAMVTRTPEIGDYQLRPFFDDSWLRTVTNIPAGRALNALVKLLTELAEATGTEIDDPWSYIFERSDAVEETDIVANLAFFPSPVEGRGSLSGLHEGNLSVGHLFRAVFERMASYYQEFGARLSPERGWERLVFSGGLAQSSALLRRLVCERLRAEHRVTASTEETLIGLLVLARVVSGLDGSVADACNSLRRQAH